MRFVDARLPPSPEGDGPRRDKKMDSDATRVNVTDFRRNMSSYMHRVYYGGERFVVTRNGVDLVAVVHPDDLETIRKMEDDGVFHATSGKVSQ